MTEESKLTWVCLEWVGSGDEKKLVVASRAEAANEEVSKEDRLVESDSHKKLEHALPSCYFKLTPMWQVTLNLMIWGQNSKIRI